MSNTRAGLPNKIQIDGYAIDLSAGASEGQALAYNGTSFVAQTISGSGIGFDYGPGIDGGDGISSTTLTVTRPMYFTTLVIDEAALVASSDLSSITTVYIDISAQTSIT